jgi:hypothetical protein
MNVSVHDKVDAVEAASAALTAGLKKLEATKDIKRRRQMAHDFVGKLVGQLDTAMKNAVDDRGPHEQALYSIVRDKVIGDSIGVLMRACEWELQA